MTDIIIRGERHRFIPHNGKSRKKAIELPTSKIAHRPTLQIQELVALSYGIHPKCMTARDRDRSFAWPRQVAMYLTRELTKRSLPSIGKAFGKRHHTTILHGIRAVEQRIKANPDYEADVSALRRVLRSVGK